MAPQSHEEVVRQPRPWGPPPDTRSDVARAARYVLVVSLVYNALLLAVHAWSVSGFGPWSLPGIELFFLPVLAALAAIPFGVVLAAFKRTRIAGTVCVTACIVFAAVGLVSHDAATRVRIWGFERAAVRAAPLVEALHRYHDEHQEAPDSLDSLVPGYIERLPGRLPDLELIGGEAAESGFHGNPWVLWVCVPTGVINWDQFMYLPLQNYPQTGHGGWLQPVGDWRYVWE